MNDFQQKQKVDEWFYHVFFIGEHRAHSTPADKHCNTLQCIAMHCNNLQDPAATCNTQQHTATHDNKPVHVATKAPTFK